MAEQFAAQFAANQVEEWTDRYINFRRLTAAIANLSSPPYIFGVQRVPSKHSHTVDIHPMDIPLLPNGGRETLPELTEEIAKVDAFFRDKLAGFRRQLVQIRHYASDPNHDEDTLRAALLEMYRGFLFLENYSTLNLNATHTLLREIDARWKTAISHWWYLRQNVSPHYYVRQSKTLRSDLEDICTLTATHCFNGNRSSADDFLNATKAPKPPAGTQFLLGLFLGISVPLLLAVVYYLVEPTKVAFNYDAWIMGLRVFRSHAVMFLAVWLWGAMVYIMQRSRINYPFIMQLEPTTVLTHHRVFKTASLLTALWLATFTAFVARCRLELKLTDLPIAAYPLILFATNCAIFFCPFKVLHRPTRWWLMRQLFQVMTAPLHRVTFASAFIAINLTSMVKLLTDMKDTICQQLAGLWWEHKNETLDCTRHKQTIDPFLTALPLVWCMLQATRRAVEAGSWYPHMVNTGKYFSGVLAITLGALKNEWDWLLYPWYFMLVFSTIYTYMWDVIFDWGFIQKSPRGHWGWGTVKMRNQFRSKSLLVLIMVINLIGRCAWAYTLIVQPDKSTIQAEALVFATSMLETVRRCMWSLFRIANEHWNNVGQYRVINQIPLAFNQAQKKKKKKVPDGRKALKNVNKFMEFKTVTAPVGSKGQSMKGLADIAAYMVGH